MESETVAQVAHDVVAVGSETDDNTTSSESEDPDWDGETGGTGARVPHLVDGCQGTHCVGDIVGTIR